MKKVSEEIFKGKVEDPRVSSGKALLRSLATRRQLGPKEKALQQTTQKKLNVLGGIPAMKPTYAENKVEDRIYTMAIVKECKNLSKEDKLAILEFIYKEPDIK